MADLLYTCAIAVVTVQCLLLGTIGGLRDRVMRLANWSYWKAALIVLIDFAVSTAFLFMPAALIARLV